MTLIIAAVAFNELMGRAFDHAKKTIVQWVTERQVRKMQEQLQKQMQKSLQNGDVKPTSNRKRALVWNIEEFETMRARWD